MQIILMYTGGGNGQVALAANRFLLAPQRQYAIVDGVVVLSGWPDDILHNDADELLKSSSYRMPTPAEQETFMQEALLASQAQETTPIVTDTDVTPTDPDAPDGSEQGNTAIDPNEPPALDTTSGKKKASGG